MFRPRGRGLSSFWHRPVPTQPRAWDNARRPKPCLLQPYPWLRPRVAAKLAADWPPEQSVGWLARTSTARSAMRISHETIYRSLFLQARRVLDKALTRHVRRRRTMRRSRKVTTGNQHRGRTRSGSAHRGSPRCIEIRRRRQIRDINPLVVGTISYCDDVLPPVLRRFAERSPT